MFKLTVYTKVNISRNFFIIVLLSLLVLVGGKIIMAHEKIATYQEALRLYQSGSLVAAEKKFRAAKLNVSVTDYNKDINLKLSILSPIREVMEELDGKSAESYEDKDLDQLADLYNQWQTFQQKWVSGTDTQKDMYGEMLALTKLDKDMRDYFTSIKQSYLVKLKNNEAIEPSMEEEAFASLRKIPSEYYGGDTAKTKEILTSFQAYYKAKINQLTGTNASFAAIVAEGERQFGMLAKFSMEAEWLKEMLNTHLLKVLTEAVNKKDYTVFAEQASSTKRLSSKMKEAKVFAYIEKAKKELLAKAGNLAAGNKFAEAIAIYEALKSLENTDLLITETNLAWDKHEPVRVLMRLYPDKEFTQVVNAKNKWGADSVVAAISKDGKLYFGKIKGEEPMVVTEGMLNLSSAINKLSFQNGFSPSENPVILIDAKSSERKHRYIAHAVQTNTLARILDVDADNLTVESKQVLLLDNPIGPGAGELAYYEPDSNGDFQFTKIKVDYIDISVGDINRYFGKKVRFSAFPAAKTSSGEALVTVSEGYNYSTGGYEKSYLLLKGSMNFTIYTTYTVIGVFNSYTTIINENGEQVRVPVFQVEKAE